MEQKHVGDGLFEFTYKNAVGAGIKLTNLGCAIMELHMPDSQGNMADVVLGYDTASGYEDNSPSIGVTIGRYANRVTCHPYEINGQTYYPVCDTGKPYVIHGDPLRFSRRAWDAEAREHSVLFKLRSEEGESGFPGNVDVGVEIALSDQNILRITYSAQTDKDTPLNLTNHSYFNLRGEGSIEEYIAQIDADHFTAYDQNLVPTGEVASVFGTPFDFNSPRAIGERIDESHPMLKAGGGYDLNYIIRGIGMRHRYAQGGTGSRPQNRPLHGNLDGYARCTVLHQQQPRRYKGQEWRAIRPPQRVLPGNAVFPGQYSFPAFSKQHFKSGRPIYFGDGIPIWRAGVKGRPCGSFYRPRLRSSCFAWRWYLRPAP